MDIRLANQTYLGPEPAHLRPGLLAHQIAQTVSKSIIAMDTAAREQGAVTDWPTLTVEVVRGERPHAPNNSLFVRTEVIGRRP